MKFIILLLFSLSAQAAMTPKVNVRGQFVKADKNFIYLKKSDSKMLVKVPRRYSLNSPTNIPKNFNLSFSMPFTEFYMANRQELSKIKPQKR